VIKFLKKLKNWTDPNYWANKIGDKSGLYDKAENSKLRKWADSLEGWQWWLWQLVPAILVIAVFEALLNTLGMTMLPWR
tara:strand:- start:1578 stop:1814 length:237 start_codon:yes stop_codon:yes gene_type:complete